jgi:hypothetical protein
MEYRAISFAQKFGLSHGDTDEAFIVMDGELRIDFS